MIEQLRSAVPDFKWAEIYTDKHSLEAWADGVASINGIESVALRQTCLFRLSPPDEFKAPAP